MPNQRIFGQELSQNARRGPNMSNETRNYILGMLDGGCTVKEAAATCGRSESAIRRLRQKFNTTGTTHDKPRSGRPHVLSKHTKKLLYRAARKNPKLEYKDLAEVATIVGADGTTSTTPSKSTLYRTLKRTGLGHFRCKKRPKLNRIRARARLRFCKEYRNFPWRRRPLKFSDECSVQYEARKLRSSVHHLSVQYELLKHENEGLKEALQHKKKHRKKGKALDLQQRQEYHGGSVFWSPRKLREARAREAVRERDETEEKLQKARSKKQREEARLQRQDELEERRVERQRLKEMRELERAEKAAERARQKEERDAAKAIQLPQKGKRRASAATSSNNKRQKRVEAARAGAQVQEEPPAPPSKLTSRGRNVNLPSKYR
ncbi:Membrane-bound metallopeptidase [Pyrenophora tritici-repentis]|uniref:Membrane-bound metallopeptidase n=1 Tax=Pyrenophora tritici-repentis TaxID=45151 RepID=A0A922SWK1_9PLEO|nr:Membrane-bound metallopeptidase [Pyrenophora tritici-repentis]